VTIDGRRKGSWKKWAAVSAGTVLLLGLAAHFSLPRLLPSAIVKGPNSERVIDLQRGFGPDQLRARGVTAEFRVAIREPEASLALWRIDPPEARSPRGTILVTHGIGDHKGSMLGVGQALARAGYRVILIDNRAHGHSTGRYLTYGVQEARDFSAVIDALQQRGLLVRPIGAIGFSYGAAVVVQAAGRDPRLAAVVSIASFSSLHEVVRDYLHHFVPVLGGLVSSGQIDDMLNRAGTLAAFDPAAASPMRAIATARARVLLIHGTADRRIPPVHAERMLNAAPDRTRLVLIDGGTHLSVLKHPRVLSESVAFFARHLVPQ
jgi:pimeloyl-ACP methyl ester carboxylesterase